MASEPDRIRQEIAATRADLASNVDQLADRTSPARMARRGWHRLTDKMHAVTDTVIGKPAEAASSIKDKASEAGDRIGEMAGEAADAVREAPHHAAEQTRGNPIAAGMIAFGAGMLAATLVPETDVERRMSRALADSRLAEEVREPLMESASSVGRDVTDTVKQSAAEVAQTAKESASEAVEEVKQTTRR